MNLFLPLLLFIEKLVAFLKQIIIADFFGTTQATDAYQLAENIVSLVRGAFANAIPISLLTVLVYKIQQKDKNENAIFFSILTWGTLIAFIVTIVMDGIIFGIDHFYSEDINQTLFDYLLRYSIILSPAIVLAYISGILSTRLEVHKSYIPAKLLSLLTSISVIFCVYLLFSKIGLISIFIGEIVALIIHIGILLVILSSKKLLIIGSRICWDESVKQVFKLSIPLMVSSSVYSANSFIDKIIATNIDAGAASVLQYARTLSLDLFPTILVTALSSVIVNTLSNAAALNDNNKMSSEVKCVIDVFTILLLPVMIFSIVFSEEIIRIVYYRGAFDEKSLLLTNLAFIGYAIGIPLFPLREVLARAFYSLHNTKIPLISSFIGIAFNIFFSFILSIKYGVFGIAIATSISILISGMINWKMLSRRYGIKVVLINVNNLKVIPAIILFSIISVGFSKSGMANSVLGLFFCGVVSIVAYIIILIFEKENSIIWLFRSFKQSLI